MTRQWLRGKTLRWFKKHHHVVNNDGVYYNAKDYCQLITDSKKLRVGDLIYNCYNKTDEPIAKIHTYWSHWHHYNCRVFEIYFETVSGYFIYDIHDKEYCNEK